MTSAIHPQQPICKACQKGVLQPKPSEKNCLYLQCSHCKINMATPSIASQQWEQQTHRALKRSS